MEKIGRTKIVDLLKRTDIGAMVNVKGWVRTRRGSKQVNFIELNDGSTINNLQVVVDLANFDEEMLKLITTGACISVNGEMVKTSKLGFKRKEQKRPKRTLVWRTGLSGALGSVQAELLTFDFLMPLSAIIHRTVRCASGATAPAQRSTPTDTCKSATARTVRAESEQHQKAHRTVQCTQKSELQWSKPSEP